jgi:RNA polymerase sigma factor (sigma-70 family)
MRIQQWIGIAVLSASLATAQTSHRTAAAPEAAAPNITVEQPDAQRTKDDLSQLLDHYPPALRNVLGLDPGLLGNQAYLAPYPALAGFLNTHPEVARNPTFYIDHNGPPPHREQVLDFWKDILAGVGVFLGFCLASSLIVWLIRTLVDYRRWNRLTKVQTEAHTKLLDRFTASEDLLAYIQSPAGAKFLESSPITLDAGASERLTDFTRAMAELKPRERAMLWLAYAEGATHREIAATLGLGEGSMKTMLFRARRKLAILLGRKEIKR